MEEENLNFLNNVKSSKETDKLLEQQILENENSFEPFDSGAQTNNNSNSVNGLNYEQKTTINNNDDKTIEETHKQNENEMNGQDMGLNCPPNKSEINIKNESIDLKENEYKNDDQMNKDMKDMNGSSIKENKIENKNNDKKINNKRKNQKKLVNSASMDNIEIENENNNKNNGDTTCDMKSGNNNKNKKHKDINRSIDNTEVNDRVNIYQRMFEIKMDYLLKQDKNINKTKPKKKMNKPHTYLIKNKNKQNSELIIKDKNEKTNKKNDKNEIKNKNSHNNNNKVNKIDDNDSNKNNKEDDAISTKPKKSRMKRKNSLNLSSSNNSTKFSQTYERFLEIQEKKKEKLNHLKKLNEEKEKKQCYFSPKINKKSESIKDNYYKRQQEKIEGQKKEKEKPKYKYREEEFDYKSFKNNSLIKQKNNNEKKHQKQKTSEVSDRINKLYQWDNNRKQKIHERQKSVDELVHIFNKKKLYFLHFLTTKEFSHKPKINKKSKKLAIVNYQKYLNTSKSGYNANNYSMRNAGNESTFDRLYRDDVLKRKERQKILEKIYSPTFSPKITKFNKTVFNKRTIDESDALHIDDDNFSIIDKKSLNVSKTYSVDKNNNMDRENIENKENKEYKDYDINSYGDISNYKAINSEMFDYNDYAEEMRSRLFAKLSRGKNKSAMHLKKINELKIEENGDDENASDDMDEDGYKKNKRNSIESCDKKLTSSKISKSYNIYKIKVKIKNPKKFETKDRKENISIIKSNKKGRNRTVGFRL